jgi:hypothetical protein
MFLADNLIFMIIFSIEPIDIGDRLAFRLVVGSSCELINFDRINLLHLFEPYKYR